MILALLALAHADPVALRAPTSGRFTAVVGTPVVSAAWFLNENVGFALDLRGVGASASASAGLRQRHTTPWGIDAGVAAGVVVPLVDPGFGVSLTPSLGGGWRDARTAGALTLAVPLELGLVGRDGVTARAPILLEPSFSAKAGPIELGVLLGAGPLFVTGSLPGVELRAGVVISGA